MGTEAARFALVAKQPPLPWTYIFSVLGAVIVLEVIPYIEELVRGLRATDGKWISPADLARRPQVAHARRPIPTCIHTVGILVS